MTIKARYTGNGEEYYSGIPARDLTDQEYAALTGEQRARVNSRRIYEVVPDKAVPPKDNA